MEVSLAISGNSKMHAKDNLVVPIHDLNQLIR